MTLASARRAADPIFADWLRAVIRLGKLHAPHVLFMDSIRSEILDQPVIECPIRIERESSAHRRGVPRIGVSADVPEIGGRSDGLDDACITTASDVAVPAVPRYRTSRSRARDIDAVGRQADTDLELLALARQVSRRRTRFTRESEIHFAV